MNFCVKCPHWTLLSSGYRNPTFMGIGKIQLSPLILIKCNNHTHHWIALWILYQNFFETNVTRVGVRPQKPVKAAVPTWWRWLPHPHFGNLRPNVLSIHFLLKCKVVERSKSHRMVCMHFKFNENPLQNEFISNNERFIVPKYFMSNLFIRMTRTSFG